MAQRAIKQRVPVCTCERCRAIILGKRLKVCPECGAPLTVHIAKIASYLSPCGGAAGNETNDPRIAEPLGRPVDGIGGPLPQAARPL
jgi:hypothetical protein